MNQTESKSQSLRIVVEKLDGGFISNVEGKRRIYKDAHSIDDAISINGMLSKVEEAEYFLNIDLIHKDDHDLAQAMAVETAVEDNFELNLIDKAKADGIIQPADQFNPNGTPKEENIHVISITAATAYTFDKLKKCPWTEWDKEIPMSIAEKSVIAKLNKLSFYATWANIVKAKSKSMALETRIGLTTLAKFYENSLGVRSCAKEREEKLREDLLAVLRDLEVLAVGPFTKSTVIATHVGKMRKLLL